MYTQLCMRQENDKDRSIKQGERIGLGGAENALTPYDGG